MTTREPYAYKWRQQQPDGSWSEWRVSIERPAPTGFQGSFGPFERQVIALFGAPKPDDATLYALRCGWCGAYEGTVDPAEPCAKDETGYIGPHQFGKYERVGT